MTPLQHPHIPDCRIEVADERVAAHRAAGWLLVEEPKQASKPRPRNRRGRDSEEND